MLEIRLEVVSLGPLVPRFDKQQAVLAVVAPRAIARPLRTCGRNASGDEPRDDQATAPDARGVVPIWIHARDAGCSPASRGGRKRGKRCVRVPLGLAKQLASQTHPDDGPSVDPSG